MFSLHCVITLSLRWCCPQTRDSETNATVAVFRAHDWMYSNPCWSPDVMNDALLLIPLNQSAAPFTVTSPVFKSSVVAAIMLCETHSATTFSFAAELKNGDSYLSVDVCLAPILTLPLPSDDSLSRTSRNQCCTSWSRHSGVPSSLPGSSTLSSSAFVSLLLSLFCVALLTLPSSTACDQAARLDLDLYRHQAHHRHLPHALLAGDGQAWHRRKLGRLWLLCCQNHVCAAHNPHPLYQHSFT